MRPLLTLLSSLALLASLAGQTRVEVPLSGGRVAQYTLHLPPAHQPSQTLPILLVPAAEGVAQAYLPLVRDGWLLAVLPRDARDLPALLRHLRLQHRVEGQRFFVLASQCPEAWAERGRGHLRLVQGGGEAAADLQALRRLRRRGRSADALVRSLGALLDDYHDAAAKGDGPRYFGHMAADGAFLGTDGTERWSTAEMQAAFARYFKGVSAWIYVPQRRKIVVRGEVAWFDEALHSDSYGPCRGSGCLVRVGDGWKILLYHLSIPVPNELSKGIVARIKRGPAPAPVTTVILVRHAEKEKGGRDPALTAAGKERAQRLARHLAVAGVQQCFTTDFKRTRGTVAPLCAALGLQAKVYAPRPGLARRILAQHAGSTVVVAGHSNTVPALIRALGVAEAPAIDESVYDNLFVVTIAADGSARLLRLRY